MAKNDTVLIDGIVAQRVEDNIPSKDKGEVFELFVLQQLLKNYDLSSEEIESGWIDGRNDGGIDGFFIFVNGHLVSDASNFIWPRNSASIDVHVVSCKHHDTFRESTLNTLLATATEIFDFSLENDGLKGSYSSDLLKSEIYFLSPIDA